MNRIIKVASNVISPVHIAFVKGRHIMAGVLIPHEALNIIHVQKQSAVIAKIDFEKSYDKVK